MERRIGSWAFSLISWEEISFDTRGALIDSIAFTRALVSNYTS